MFKNQRYATCGVNARIPILTQLILWEMIDDLKAVEPDYFQVFHLSEEYGMQKVIHEQEQPEYKRTCLFVGVEPVNEKIYIIDSIDYRIPLPRIR